MSDVALIIGPVTLGNSEVSAGIRFGGQQHLTVHRLPGGNRVIDTFGRDDAEIVITGFFVGEDATLRVRTLDELRAAGATLPLTWDVFYYSVVLRELRAEYRNRYWIPYRITCTVLRDEAAALVEAALSLAETIVGDVSAAASQTLAGVDLSNAQLALSAPNATVAGTADATAASESLAASQSAVESSIGQAGASLVASGSTLSTSTDPNAGAAALLNATAAGGQLSALANMRGYLGRAAVNLENAGS